MFKHFIPGFSQDLYLGADVQTFQPGFSQDLGADVKTFRPGF